MSYIRLRTPETAECRSAQPQSDVTGPTASASTTRARTSVTKVSLSGNNEELGAVNKAPSGGRHRNAGARCVRGGYRIIGIPGARFGTQNFL
jgi:hypothetical protein